MSDYKGKPVVLDEGFYIECTNPDCGLEGLGEEGDPCDRCGSPVQYAQREPDTSASSGDSSDS